MYNMEDLVTLYGLAFECPYLARIDNCPLSKTEVLGFSDMVMWVNGLTKEERSTILAEHYECFVARGKKLHGMDK